MDVETSIFKIKLLITKKTSQYLGQQTEFRLRTYNL